MLSKRGKTKTVIFQQKDSENKACVKLIILACLERGSCIMLKKLLIIATASFFIGLSSVSFHVNGEGLIKPIATEQIFGTRVSFQQNRILKNITLSISGPDGFNAQVFSESAFPYIDLEQFGRVVDGIYNYQISAATDELLEVRDKLDNGRGENNRTYINKGVRQSGTFRIIDGQVALDLGMIKENRRAQK